MRMTSTLPWIALLILLPLQGWAADQGTNIIGTQESPNVLNVVPWQERELGVDPWDMQPGHDSDVLNDTLKPVDRGELQRQVEYFNLLRDTQSQAIEP